MYSVVALEKEGTFIPKSIIKSMAVIEEYIESTAAMFPYFECIRLRICERVYSKTQINKTNQSNLSHQSLLNNINQEDLDQAACLEWTDCLLSGREIANSLKEKVSTIYEEATPIVARAILLYEQWAILNSRLNDLEIDPAAMEKAPI